MLSTCWLLLATLGLALATSAVPCSELHRELRYPCRCTPAEDGIVMDCDRVVFPGDLPALPYRAPVVSFSQRWAGHQALPTQAFMASSLPLRALDFSGNSLRRLTDRLLMGLQSTLQELRLADNLLGDNLNPIFSSSEFHGLSRLKLLDLSGNLIKGIEEGILKGCDNLQELLLDNNCLTTVPSSSLNGPRTLKVLSLTNNRIGIIRTGAFQSQRSLENLDLSYNLVVTLEARALAGLNRLRTLYLAHNRLTRFNSDPELERLDLSRNNIANIAPGTFLGLSHLRELDLSVNALRTVEDDAFEGLSALETLSLKDNNILLVPASALGRLPSLTSLQLDYNRVAALSGDILRAVAGRVTALSLARNVVRELPSSSFKEFTHLEALDLSGNLLANIAAATFAGLENNLVELNLSGNRLTSLPSPPIALPQLQYLDVSRNQLAEIPRLAFTQMTSLIYLNLSQNPALGSISPTLLQNLPELTELDLSQTGLKMLSPELLLRSQNLEKVYLSDNLIQELPEGAFRNLKNLTIIDLSRNQILNIRTGAFMGLKSIQELYLNSNRLTAFKGEFFRNFGTDGSLGTNLQILDLADNELSYLFPSSFRVHPKLRRLSAAGNKFSFFPAELIASLQYLEYVDLGRNSLRSIEDLDFASLPRLRTLILNNNDLETISELAFQNSTQLQNLDLSSNKLERLSERTFEGLVRLEMLNLENNLLSELPDAIFERSRLQMLESINLAGNRFESAPLQPLQRQYFFLSAVDLSRNQLREIPPEDSIMVNIKKLDLSYNPLSQEAVENVLGEPKTVRELNLAGTGITSVTQMETPFLRKLNLSHNSINSLPDTVFERPTLLEQLDVSFNSLTELPHVWQRLKNLQALDVSENPVMSILQGDLDGLEGLRALKIHDLAMCTRLEKNAFKALGNLAELEAYGYPRLGYIDIPGILRNLPALERLDIELKDAAIGGDQLTPALQPRLRELGLRGPRVRSLSSGILAGLRGPSVRVGLRNTSVSALPPALFFTLPRSTRLELDVSGSKLSTLGPPLLAALDERKGDLSLIGLSENPINCDCSARALRRWLPGAGMSGIRCVSPENLAGQLLIEVADDELTCDPNRPSSTPSSSLSPSSSTTASTEPDIIWSVPPKDKTSSSSKPSTGISNKSPPSPGASNMNNDDTLIIGIVGGVVAFIAVLIIVICIVRIRITNSQYRGGPLATPGALSNGHAPSMVTAGSGCTCVKPPMGPPMYISPYGPGYATLPPKLMPPTSVSPRPQYSTMGRQPYYQSPPYYITYPTEEKEHR
ncbi:hypothetical protein C0J52_09408 [Blattella germanica]|nr:hypothetical protein C0J52_09408 [Blattella germanica]